MRKLKTILKLFMVGLLLFSGNCFAATTGTSSSVTNTTKYIAIGLAVLVIILLLILGYRMDSREIEPDDYIDKRNKKREKNNIIKDDPKYEADKVVYEADNINTNDLLETTEYDENEDILFSDVNDENSIDEKDSPLDNISNNDVDLDELDNMLNDVESNSEEYGEDFDTSIIDSIDEDEIETQNPKNNIEETMVFDINKTLENKIEDVPEEFIDEKDEEIDPIIEELNSIDDETDFEDFSAEIDDILSEKENEPEKEENCEEKKLHKHYTKFKKISSSTDDFLAQMEENLKKDKEEKDAKNN